MQQPVDFRDEFEQAVRVLPVSRFHAEPHPTLSVFSFHFALRRSLATAQSKLFGAAIEAPFDPKSRTNVVCEICWPSNTSKNFCLRTTFRDVRNERICSPHRHNPTEPSFGWTENQNTIGPSSCLVS